MASTIVGYFDDREEARRTAEDLIQSGFDSSGIEVVSTEESTRLEDTGSSRSGGFMDWFRHSVLGRTEERDEYMQAVEHGGCLVTATVPEERVDMAAEIMERHHPNDIEEHRGSGMAASGKTMAEGSATLPVTEERLAVGKRAVRRGSLRIHERVTETPVEEQVSLKDEHIDVERHATDRPARAGETQFEEREFEMTESREEPVVSKEARVVEEVSISKETDERKETIRDTVRRKDVDIDRDRGRSGGGSLGSRSLPRPQGSGADDP